MLFLAMFGQTFEGLYSIDKNDKVTLGVAKETPQKVMVVKL